MPGTSSSRMRAARATCFAATMRPRASASRTCSPTSVTPARAARIRDELVPGIRAARQLRATECELDGEVLVGGEPAAVGARDRVHARARLVDQRLRTRFAVA